MTNKILFISLLGILAHSLQAQPPASALIVGSARQQLDQARAHPDDSLAVLNVVSTFRNTRDLAAIAAIKQIFQVSSDKYSRQMVAMLLIRLGQSDDVHFNTLYDYARIAIESKVPMPYFEDPEGNEIRGAHTLEFRNWCGDHGMTEIEGMKATSVYITDLTYFASVLASVKDSRAASLLRSGLDSKNSGILIASIYGLGRLNDTDSLPMIESAVARLKPKMQAVAAYGISAFDSAMVTPLLDRFVPDKQSRQTLDEQIRNRRASPQK